MQKASTLAGISVLAALGEGLVLSHNQKEQIMKNLAVLVLSVIFTLSTNSLFGQVTSGNLKSIAVVSLDSDGISLDNAAMGDLLRLELEKVQKYEVLDKYDVANQLKERNIDPNEAFGKSQLVTVGNEVRADYMLSGSAQKFGAKIVYILRLIDVKGDKIIKTDVKEYIYDEQYIQLMTRNSLASLLGIEADAEVAAKLKYVDTPIVAEGQSLKLSGPRFGMQFFTGDIANRLTAPEAEGGYNSTPFATVFAYQYEYQYVSSGDFQVLLESIISINGIETSYTSPSLTLLNGFRYKGWELGFGPVFRFSRVAEGYYDENNQWQISNENTDVNQELITTIDKRGDLSLSTGLLIAVGKNFRSGNINLPVNFYYSQIPSLNSHVFGFMLGFNIARSK